MSQNKGEPTLEKIDDYNGNESKQKRNTVRLIIFSLLCLAIVLSYLKETYSDDTKDNLKIEIKNP